jgi:hypothetical protein
MDHIFNGTFQVQTAGLRWVAEGKAQHYELKTN